MADFAIGARTAGIELSVGHLGGRGAAAARLQEAGVEPVEVPVRGLLGAADRRIVREQDAVIDPELLHTHLTHADLLGGLAGRSLGIPAVSTLHVAWWGGELRERIKFRLAASARRRYAARVIAVSEAARRTYLNKRWDRADHVVAVHNGIVDVELGVGPRIRAELGIDADDVVLGMVSVLRGWKGHELAAEAVARLLGEHGNLRLLIVGDGPKRAEIETQTRSLGDRVVFAGYRTDVTEVLDAVDLLVHPSSAAGFRADRASAGDGGGGPNRGERGRGHPGGRRRRANGVLIEAPPSVDALVAALAPLLEDRSLRGQLATAARARFESRFSVDRWFERLIPVYEAALGTGPGALSRCPGRRRGRRTLQLAPSRRRHGGAKTGCTVPYLGTAPVGARASVTQGSGRPKLV